MNELQKQVALFRRMLADQKELSSELWEAVVQGEAYQDWLAAQETYKSLQHNEESAKATLGEAALYARAKDGDGQPMPGVTIKQVRRVEYDVVAATNWCHTHAPALLSLDPRRFEPAVRDGLIICPIAQVKVVLKPYVDSNLSRFLEE